MANVKLDDDNTFSSNEKRKIVSVKHEALKVKHHINIMLNAAAPIHNLFGLVLAGGCFSSLYHGETVRDYDVFILKTTESLVYDIGNRLLTYMDRLSSEDIRNKAESEAPRIKFGDSSYLNNSNNGGNITKTVFDEHTKIQLIFTEFKTRQELIDHFDCEHACVSLDLETETLYISRDTYDCIDKKVIKKHKDNNILGWRKQKFANRGWKVA
jgi:hypothetical protein